jgi:hypothetical protein
MNHLLRPLQDLRFQILDLSFGLPPFGRVPGLSFGLPPFGRVPGLSFGLPPFWRVPGFRLKDVCCKLVISVRQESSLNFHPLLCLTRSSAISNPQSTIHNHPSWRPRVSAPATYRSGTPWLRSWISDRGSPIFDYN